MPQLAEWVDAWCRVCCTQHTKDDCPGELLATGPERHGWRLLAEKADEPIVFGTLVAPADDRWRARILTYPNVLWVLPSGGTMKFVGITPALTEKKAIDFIKAHCRRNGLKMRTEVPSVESGTVDLEQTESTARSAAVQASQRQKRALRVSYGVGRITDEAETDDLSEGGLFIRTDEPLPLGAKVNLRVDLDGFGIPLRGEVRWAQAEEEVGRPRGMGIELDRPHPRYIHFLRQQKQHEPESGTSSALEEWDDPEI